MKKTALTRIHESLGAKMIEFAGYLMPVQYEGVNIEHRAVRNAVGMFDVSHMGEFIIKGNQALETVQKLTSNDASILFPGKVQYSCMPNENGGIVDDLLVYRLGENEYMLVVNAANMSKDWKWIQAHKTKDVEIEDISGDISLLAVQGPSAEDVLRNLTDVDIDNMKYYTFTKGNMAGRKGVIISKTGYTGSGGFELYMPNDDAEHIWNRIMEEGAAYGIKPCGLAARDTLRLEMGFCLYGNDIDETTTPLEAGLGWITKTGKDFIGRDKIIAQKENGITEKLVGFTMKERAIPRHGYEIFDAGGNRIGRVTSGTMSPSLGIGIGMGYVATEFSGKDMEIFIQIRKKTVPATVVKLPFYSKK